MKIKKDAHNRASDWFNDLYSEHKDNHENIPWARQAVNPLLESYLEDETQVHTGKALVIGCGLGDDACALSLAGYDVVAIDVSEVALELAREKFPDSKIKFEVQDVFEMPRTHSERFDFVFEALTIQSLPVEFREKMINAIADTLAPNAKLLLVAHERTSEFDGPPWPLTKEEVDLFKSYGLKELALERHTEESKISNVRFRVLYQRLKD